MEELSPLAVYSHLPHDSGMNGNPQDSWAVSSSRERATASGGSSTSRLTNLPTACLRRSPKPSPSASSIGLSVILPSVTLCFSLLFASRNSLSAQQASMLGSPMPRDIKYCLRALGDGANAAFGADALHLLVDGVPAGRPLAPGAPPAPDPPSGMTTSSAPWL